MKNKTLFILASILFLSCSEKETIEAEKEIKKPETTLYSVIVGQQLKLPIKKGTSDYTLKTDNQDILSFEYFPDKEMVTIKTLQCGKASIFVIDELNDTINIIKVWPQYLGSPEIEEWGKLPTISPEVLVESKDTQVKQLIEDELWKYVNERIGAKYIFDNKTLVFKMDITQLNEQYQGTYIWSADSLILNYNNITEMYGSTIIQGKDYYIIEADKTKEYQSRYPQSDIISVKIRRIWYDSGKLSIH